MTDHNTIEGLRARLFAAIDGVRDGTLEIDRAKTIGDLSQVIVNSAKVELDYVRATEGTSHSCSRAPGDEEKTTRELPRGIVRVVQHKIKE
jgi:hypothetical protein